MLGLKLNHVDKRGPWSTQTLCKIPNKYTVYTNKYGLRFAVLYFVEFMLLYTVDFSDSFNHILEGKVSRETDADTEDIHRKQRTVDSKSFEIISQWIVDVV